MTPAQSPPGAALPEEPKRYDIDQSEDGGGLCPGEDYVTSADYDALRAAASGLGAQVAAAQHQTEIVRLERDRFRDEASVAIAQKMSWQHSAEAAEQRADGLAAENQRLKESFDLLMHDKVTTIERAEAAEASAQSAVARAAELERALRWLDSLGGLGLDKHAAIDAALNPPPPVEHGREG